jgi:hypothetical protein
MTSGRGPGARREGIRRAKRREVMRKNFYRSDQLTAGGRVVNSDGPPAETSSRGLLMFFGTILELIL